MIFLSDGIGVRDDAGPKCLSENACTMHFALIEAPWSCIQSLAVVPLRWRELRQGPRELLVAVVNIESPRNKGAEFHLAFVDDSSNW